MKASLDDTSRQEEKKKQRELAVRFGKAMIRKTYKAKKKRDKRVHVGVVCEDDIIVRSSKQKEPIKTKRNTTIECSDSYENDESTKNNGDHSLAQSIFEENSLLDDSNQEDATKQNSQDEDSIKIPTTKYYETIGFLNDLEFIEISKFSSIKRKVLEIKKVVDGGLNYDELEEDFLSKPYKLYVCIQKDSRNMVACLIAEGITKAKPIIFESRKNSTSSLDSLYQVFKQTMSTQLSLSLDAQPSPTTTHLNDNHPSLDMTDMNFHDLSECSNSEYTKAVLGVSRIWVSNTMRRRGVASKLLDLAREHFTYGYKVPRKYIGKWW
ncbi:hypothetical protein C9374_014052 [Naegleria lovaniensis]|uniref:N-acetyltransferase ESCO acetyl-transferase domain-containing protein n=1 Tax=Naegleria lovaniensis TaxID=51637 RepID=A0AA88GYM4_NAELO|nr:uncharacterized protein C9374_014052 [Naegleria lovaniensis]KAG2389492.1 hypothetical protein C9374_014052 [Naegleria lovaniensis]